MSDEVKPVKPSVKEEADKAIADGSDKSKGGYDALMDDFNRASQTFSKPADMEAYSKQVIDGLKQSGTLGDHALNFAKQNFDRLNNGGEVKDKGLDRSEVNPSKGQNALEKAFLEELTNNFSEVQRKRWFQNEKPGVITEHDVNKALEDRSKPRDDSQRAAYEGDKAAMANKDVQDFSKALFANKNGGADSLFNRLDVLDRDADGQFGRKSLESYLRLADTDPNLPHKELVGRMLNEWDKPAMQAMRGERPDHGNNRDHMNGPTYNDNININRLARTLGSDPDSLFKSGRSDGTAATATPDRVPPPRQSAIAEVHDRPRDNRGREGQLPGAPVPGRRVEQEANEPVPRNREQPPRRPVERQQSRPVDAAPQSEAPPPKPVEVRTDPKVPDFKADISEQDLAKTREAYAQELAKTYQERTMRKVEAGDGWDRIARRELRASGQDASEQNVVKYSEEIAKLNGRAGRLDTDNILKRDQPPVRVHTDEWAQEQVKAKLDEFDKEVARRKAAAAAAAAPPVDNFKDGRSGGTDVKPPAKPAAEIPKPGGPQAAVDAAPKVAPEVKPGQPALVESAPPVAAAKPEAAPKAPAEAPKAPADAAKVAPEAPKDDAAAKAKAEADAAAAAAKAKTEADAAAAAAKAKTEADAAKVKADADAKAKADAAKAKADADARAKAAKPAAPTLDITDLGPPGS